MKDKIAYAHDTMLAKAKNFSGKVFSMTSGRHALFIDNEERTYTFRSIRKPHPATKGVGGYHTRSVEVTGKL